MTDLPDDELILMYREGDADAFDVLFARHSASVYNFARCLLGDGTLAEDVLQETFLSVARAARRYEPRGRFRTWLMRIARNRSLNVLDRERRRAVAAEIGPAMAAPVGRAPRPEARIEADERLAAIRSEIGRLPERQREALVLHAFEAMPYAEIAAVLDMPVNTIKTLIRRARIALARTLE